MAIIPNKKWAKWITRFCATDVSRPAIAGIWLQDGYWYATNGHRMVITPDCGQIANMPQRRVIPADALNAIAMCDGPLYADCSGSLTIRSGTAKVDCIEDMPPDGSRLVDALEPDLTIARTFTLTRKELDDAIAQASAHEPWTPQEALEAKRSRQPKLGLMSMKVGKNHYPNHDFRTWVDPDTKEPKWGLFVKVSFKGPVGDDGLSRTVDQRDVWYSPYSTYGVPVDVEDALTVKVDLAYLLDAVDDCVQITVTRKLNPMLVSVDDGTMHLIMGLRK